MYACLKESVLYFGFNPHHCFSASLAPSNLLQLQQDVQEEVNSIPWATSMKSLLTETRSTSGMSPLIFKLSPKDKQHLLGSPQIGAVSMWALDLLLKEYEKQLATAAADFYDVTVGLPGVASLRGKVMERQVLKYFLSKVFRISMFILLTVLPSSLRLSWSFQACHLPGTFIHSPS